MNKKSITYQNGAKEKHEYAVWKKIISKYPLLNIEATVELAQQAYELIRQYKIDIEHPLFAASEDTRIFQAWVKEFTSKCELNRPITDNKIVLPNKQAGKQQRVNVPDEIISMALWAKKHSQAVVGCIVLDLANMRPQLEYILNKIKVNVQILEPLEIIGQNFDYLWVMGMNNKDWPPSPNFNPFIPIQLQQQPDWCRLTQVFARSAANIIYSYNNIASPLIKNVPEIDLAELNLPEFILYETKSVIMKAANDTNAPALNPDKPTRGGSKIFQLQALCPFRAFAECRLGAKELEPQQLGLNAKQRGILVHTVLEHIWQTIGNHEQLCAYTDAELKTIINKCVADVLTEDCAFIKLEQKRLQQLIWDWLTLEKTRIPFTVIAQEQINKINIGKLKNVSIRVDRIDQLQDGSLLILDYKTGQASTKGWFDERLEEPQLPLYCITNSKLTNGIILAQVKNGSLKFKGITQQVKQIPKVKTSPNWHELVNSWHTNLTKLADEFCDGHAAVDPKDGKKTCRNCKLQCLCRKRHP